MKKARVETFYLPHWAYTNKQRQIVTLWGWFERLAREGQITWANIDGDIAGDAEIEAGCKRLNGVFSFTIKGGLVVRGCLF